MLTPRPPLPYSLYDLPIAISCDVGSLDAEIARVLGPFAARDGVIGPAQPTAGIIRPYEQADVVRHLSPRARRVATHGAPVDLYADGERFWLIDDRCGIVEVNLLKNQWRAWVLRGSRLDPVRTVETTVLWPVAQLLRGRGLHLVQAASVVRNGFGILLLSPLSLTSELAAMVRAGCRVVGQRWTALRETGGGVEMLHLPGLVERPAPARRPALAHGRTGETRSNPLPGGIGQSWIDLGREHCGIELPGAPCAGVFIVSPGRRPTAHLRRLDGAEALDSLRGRWPIESLHPLRRHAQMLAALAASCACYEVGLSRDPHDLLALMGALPQRGINVPAPAASARQGVKVTLHPLATARSSEQRAALAA